MDSNLEKGPVGNLASNFEKGPVASRESGHYHIDRWEGFYLANRHEPGVLHPCLRVPNSNGHGPRRKPYCVHRLPYHSPVHYNRQRAALTMGD